MSTTMLKWFFVQVACLSIVSVTPHYIPTQEIIETTTTVSLPADYIHYPTINAAFKVHHERRNWSGAKQTCISEGGRLAVVDTVEKVQYVKANKPKYTDVWIGVIRENSDWVTADDHSQLSNLPWEQDRPDSFGDCAVVNVNGDGICNKLCIWRRAFVCEILTTPGVHQSPNVV